MAIVVEQTQQQKRIHPHKFTLWVAIGSIIMMFAGLTSAYIVKSNQSGWQSIEMPRIFWYSTGTILLSSVTMQMALRSFKQRQMNNYRFLVVGTFLLGVVFVILQWIGFRQLWASGVRFRGSSGGGQFLYVIAGLHALHVLGGVIALMLMFIKAFLGRIKLYGSVPVEIMATYWHFVDVLWIYLLVFFIWMG
ncbi:MAG: heme-copper oxidase subunit III [Chitinophagales bacterium]